MVNMIKNSAVASYIGLVDLTFQANRLLDFSARAYESFIAITLAYIFLCLLVTWAMRLLERRLKLPGSGGRHA